MSVQTLVLPLRRHMALESHFLLWRLDFVTQKVGTFTALQDCCT